MTGRRRNAAIAGLAGAALLGGLVAWAWNGEWRWALTGLLVSLFLAFVGEMLDS